jgi:acetyl-CoA acetyltransferase
MGVLDVDEGVFPTTAEGLAKLRPVVPGGTVTFGSQTHPADGNAGCLVTTQGVAKELATDPGVTVRLVSFGEARVKKGFMAMATVPAAQQALRRAGFTIGEVAIKTHNPFAVNDVYFSRELGVAKDAMNHYGSSLVFGHPQGPTGLRLVAELVEELVLAGGGRGLFVGCAAGDSAAALCLEVTCA